MNKFAAASLLLIAWPGIAQIVAIRAGILIDPAHGTGARGRVILIENRKSLTARVTRLESGFREIARRRARRAQRHAGWFRWRDQ